MRQSLLNGCFNGFTAPLYFPHPHSALHRSDAEVRHVLGVGSFDEESPRFFSDEECNQFVLDDFEDKAEVLAN
jgi:hypothetical protein